MYIKLLCIVVQGFIQWGRGIDFRPNLFQHATPSLYKPSGDLETTLIIAFSIHDPDQSSLDHCILNTLHVPDHMITVYSIHYMSLIT